MEIKKVYYNHYRYNNGKLERYYRSGTHKSRFMPDTRGGVTECIAIVRYGTNEFEVKSISKCSLQDNFCYEVGRGLAKFRLQHLLGHINAMENLIESRV